jgi:hypothetical protein
MSDTVLYSSSERNGVIAFDLREARKALNSEVPVEAAVGRMEDDPEVRIHVLGANTAQSHRGRGGSCDAARWAWIYH